ncbi:hypothetical protein J2847_006806 [Azospirillum agricola]|uniref:hypothetical protein n=1 Tax=Azospirillum agricola TaxID=1720247 RepID=UPI001AE2FA4E|nr:hypothetical protein [Azospirillum agricola]MBP2233468.1 hypothetical protein [Azospirillum agricola]
MTGAVQASCPMAPSFHESGTAEPSQPDPARRRTAGELVAQGGVDGTEAPDLEGAAADQLARCWPSC